MRNRIPRSGNFAIVISAAAAILAAAISLQAQSSRPRRVAPMPTPTPDTLLGPPPKSSPATDKNAPLLDVKPAKPIGEAPASSSTDTTHAFRLFQQKQYAPAAKEAKAIAAIDPETTDANSSAAAAPAPNPTSTICNISSCPASTAVRDGSQSVPTKGRE